MESELSTPGAKSSSASLSLLSSFCSTIGFLNWTVLLLLCLRVTCCAGLVTPSDKTLLSCESSPFAVIRPIVSTLSTPASVSSFNRWRLRGGILTAGRYGLRRYGRPNGIPSMRCCPPSLIWTRPVSARARTSAVRRGRILRGWSESSCEEKVRRTYETRSSSFSAWETGEKCRHSKPCTSTT
jgi:hypothetical protein